MPDTNQPVPALPGRDAARTPIEAWREAYGRDMPPEPGHFELGLCMAGAVSAGAYTAGVLDVLVEALDAFAAEKARRGAAGEKPLHDVTLSVLGGASAGGMCAAIAAIFLDTRFPHVRPIIPAPGAAGEPEASPGLEPGRHRDNPFWRAWVEDIDIRALLHTRDLSNGRPLVSLLDCTVLDEIVDDLLDARAEPGRRLDAPRPWLADPLRVVLTLSNLRGVPYALHFEDSDEEAGEGRAGKFRHWMSHHADHVRFCVTLGEVAGPDGVAWARGDAPKVGETPLNRDASRGSPDRERFKAVALGTGSFPVALSPRVLQRDPDDYAFRAALLPGSPLWDTPLTVSARWIGLVQPAWAPPVPDPYKALCVDGGAMNNEPLDLVRRVLSGQQKPNLRPATEAQRALVLIDPFVKPEKEGPDGDLGLLGSILPLFNALIQNSRFKPEDLALAADPAIGSRFLIAPSRGEKPRPGERWDPGKSHIAAGPLGGFLGFFHRKYREHDYLLGRRNALRFLRWVFVLPASNRRVFAGPGGEALWGDTDVAKWKVRRRGSDSVYLPVIPLCGDLLARAGDEEGGGGEPVPAWPDRAFDPEEIRAAVEHRVAAVVPKLGAMATRAMGLDEAEGWADRAKALLLRQGMGLLTGNIAGRITRLAMKKIREGVDALGAPGPRGR